jgi:microcin C transport system substrate-binding protein
MNRRSLLTTTLFAFAAPRLSFDWIRSAKAQQNTRRHGVALFGELKYPADFKHFEYVNTNAPKCGTVRLIALGTFDNFNIVVSGVKGVLAVGVDFIYDRLSVPSLDEAGSEYGLLAEAISCAADFSSASYRLRADAKWNDGVPVTSEDVIFSFEAFRKYSPRHSDYYRHVVSVEKTGDRDLSFTFDEPGNRELPQIVGGLVVLPKHWWAGIDASGNKRDLGATTLEPPLGSGPYRIKEFSPGRNIVYERVKNYWGSAVNVNIGANNFDELRYEYVRDTAVALEAFKAGVVDWRIENSAKNWATGYDFSAVGESRVLIEEFPIRNVGTMQAFAFNIRRKKFQDARARLAFNYAFDFEKMNKLIFYGQYRRIASYFENTELAATGLPTGKELQLLEMVRDNVPREVFEKPYSNPVNDSPGAWHAHLLEAARLFKAAGYEVYRRKLVNIETDEPYVVELLSDDTSFERVFLFYRQSLERLGITVTVRMVDSTQYENRIRAKDFDIIVATREETLSPGNEQRGYWGSQAADQFGSLNLIGIKEPAIDAMINEIIFAKSRADLEAATRALDRILLWNHYVVPQWTYGKVRTARWDRFGHPGPMPSYGATAFPNVWWWDDKRAAKAG